MATPFKKGLRVLCINGTAQSRRTDPFRAEDIETPKKGKVYTVREVIDTGYGIGLRLVEIENISYVHSQGGTQEPCFSVDRFRILDGETVVEEAYKDAAAQVLEKLQAS